MQGVNLVAVVLALFLSTGSPVDNAMGVPALRAAFGEQRLSAGKPGSESVPAAWFVAHGLHPGHAFRPDRPSTEGPVFRNLSREPCLASPDGSLKALLPRWLPTALAHLSLHVLFCTWLA